MSFFPENSDIWKLIGKNEGITLEENFEIDYKITGASILSEDKSKKCLIYREFNKTGIDLYLYRTVADNAKNSTIQIDIKIGKSKNRNELGTVLTAEVDILKKEDFVPYIEEKVYKYITPPERYPEYKLEHLKFLSPIEREKYKSVNGI